MGRISIRPKRKSQSPAPVSARGKRGFGGVWLRYREPAGIGFLVCLCLTAMIYPIYANIHSGTAGRAIDNVYARIMQKTKQQGLTVEEILVDGRIHTNSSDILTALDIHQGDPILSIDLDVAQGLLLALPWVESATVERRLPSTVYIHLTERVPMAIWQYKGVLSVIDHRGGVILDADIKSLPNLMTVVGPDAPSYAGELIDILQNHDALQQRVLSAVRVGQRRWDLHLNNEMVIKLPEKNPELAIEQLAQMQNTSQVLDQDYVGIDLRLPDRMYLQTKQNPNSPKPGAMAAKADQTT